MVLCGLLSCRECNRGTKTAMRDNDVLIDLMQIARKKHVAFFNAILRVFVANHQSFIQAMVLKRVLCQKKRRTCKEGPPSV
jgi:hypothetical protein